MKQMKTLTIGSTTYEVVDEAARGRTYADVGAAPAVESTVHPGCYYRTVGGVTEWVNPPMVAGVEYRTTERYEGRPVYAQYFNYGYLPNNSFRTESLPVSTTCELHVGHTGYGNYGSDAYTVDIDNLITVFQLTNDGRVRLETNANYSSWSVAFVVKYIK